MNWLNVSFFFLSGDTEHCECFFCSALKASYENEGKSVLCLSVNISGVGKFFFSGLHCRTRKEKRRREAKTTVKG